MLTVATSAVAVASGRSAGPAPPPRGESFRPPPRGLLASGELRFTPLTASQLARVRVTPARADEDARGFGGGAPWRVVYESLGGYVNDNRIIHDWVGTRSFVPAPRAAYLVRMTGGSIPSLGPAPATTADHFWNVVVDAVTGRVIVAFAYD